MNKTAFTMAEVLITLGIIGVVAAMTLPAIIQNYQKNVIKNQFKKSYSLMQQVLLKTEADLGSKPDCFYWSVSNPYGAICTDMDTYGNCLHYEMPDGSAVPADKNGRSAGCPALFSTMEKNLNVIKKCVGNAYKNGCIPDYEGLDTIQGNQNPDLTPEDLLGLSAGCPGWRKSEILNKRTAYVLKDGTIIFLYNNGSGLFAIDVNGMKKPNKWGHDLFDFVIESNLNEGFQLPGGYCVEKAEKGGVLTKEMIKNLYK